MPEFIFGLLPLRDKEIFLTKEEALKIANFAKDEIDCYYETGLINCSFIYSKKKFEEMLEKATEIKSNARYRPLHHALSLLFENKYYYFRHNDEELTKLLLKGDDKMKIEKEVKISEIKRCTYYQPRLDDSFKITLKNDNLSESEYEKLCKISKSKNIKLTLEAEEPILDEVERKYLSGVIRPFRDKVYHILKCDDIIFENICIITKYNNSDKITWLPPFEKGTMYKGMKTEIEYTLEELGL